MNPVKLIITSKKNLQTKYKKNFTIIEKLFKELILSDAKRNLDTSLIYIDDMDSMAKIKLKSVSSITRTSAKQAVDNVYNKINPAYILIFGSQDIFPFQELVNLASDDDLLVPSDLPYACAAKYSTKIVDFTGPTRVVGRIPDIPGQVDMNYLKIVFDSIISYKPVMPEKLENYFSISADVWKLSTQQSLVNIFGNNDSLKKAPASAPPYSAADLKPLIHFYNCHGAPIDSNYYGQKGSKFPVAQHAADIDGKLTKGTIAIAECCYGAEVFDPNNEGLNCMSMASTYLKNKAIAFLGSSTIAYGPSSGQGLADLITQYFVKNVLSGASNGRSLLEARQKFLTISGPQLDAYELKTLAQFYLLGDPSIQVVVDSVSIDSFDSVDNRRINLFSKGIILSKTLATPIRLEKVSKTNRSYSNEMKDILKQVGFTGREEEVEYQVKAKSGSVGLGKGMIGTEDITFRTYVKPNEKKISSKSMYCPSDVLVIKESGNKLLGWRLYHAKS